MNTSPTPDPQAPQGVWFFPYREMRLADGSVLVKPLKPVLVMSARDTARFTKLSTKTLARLAESGIIRAEWPTPRMPRYFPGEVFEFLRETRENPDYWTPDRLRQYGMARRVKK